MTAINYNGPQHFVISASLYELLIRFLGVSGQINAPVSSFLPL